MKRTFCKRLKKSISAILATAMSLSLFTTIPASAEIGITTYNYDGYSVDYNVTNEWDGTQIVDVTVSNTGTESILNWALKYDAEGEISNLWNAAVYEQNGDEYVIKNIDWNFEIAPSQSVTYGYTLSGSNLSVPKSFEIYSKRVDKTEGYDVQYNITNEWETGVEGNIVITNLSNAPIEAWTLSFDSNFTIENLWDGRVLENNGTSYTIAAEMWTNPIQPNSSMTIGFVGTKAADIEATLDNFRLTEVIIGGGGGATSPVDPPLEHLEITANAVYDEESGNITISWESNNPNGTFEILMSADGENFVSVGTVEGVSEFVYTPADEFETLYFKVVQTVGEQTAESNVVAVAKSADDIAISASAIYDEESSIIIISWTTNKEDGYFEIFMSNDGENYNSLGITENTNEFIYNLTDDFSVLYFKVKQTIEEKSAESNIVPIMLDEEDNHIVDMMSWDEMDDTDGDGLPDYIEYEYGTDINNIDTDGDGLPDGYEVLNCGTNPALFDTDKDGTSDADEDLDGDGLSNIQEYKLGTSPIVKDSDGDGLSDGDEVNIYNTDSLVYDSDSDGICDGDEIIIGLNPNNPATFGVPDSEYTFEQVLITNNDVFNLINYDENPFELSLKLNAAGNAENSIIVSKSGYSIIMDNESILGCVPEINYDPKLKVENIEISFYITNEYVTERYSNSRTELSGIHKYNIFTYNEDLNMLMPIVTEYDEANNRIYSNVEDIGTYFVVDMNKWIEQFGIESTSDSARVTAYSLSENSNEKSEYIDVAFLIYTNQQYLNVIKKQLTTTVEEMYSKYDNIRVFFVVYSGSAYVCGLTGNKYAESVEEASNIINRLSYTPSTAVTTVNGFNTITDLEWRENSQCHMFMIDALVEPMCKFDMPSFTNIIDNNINVAICHDPNNSNASIYKAMTANTYANVVAIDRFLIPLITFPEKDETMFMSTNLLPVKLDNKITKNYVDAAMDLYYNEDKRDSYSTFADTDNDGLYDFEEINFDSKLISFNDNGIVKLPTFEECLNSTNDAKILTALDIYSDKSFYDEVMDKNILLVNSDPTSDDGDGDGILDFDEVAIIKEELKNSTFSISTFSTSNDVDSDGDGIPDNVEKKETILNASKANTLIDILASKFGDGKDEDERANSLFTKTEKKYYTDPTGNREQIYTYAVLQTNDSPIYIELSTILLKDGTSKKLLNQININAKVQVRGRRCTDNNEDLKSEESINNLGTLSTDDFFSDRIREESTSIGTYSGKDMQKFVCEGVGEVWSSLSNKTTAKHNIFVNKHDDDFYKGMQFEIKTSLNSYVPKNDDDKNYIDVQCYTNRCGVSNASNGGKIKTIFLFDSYCKEGYSYTKNKVVIKHDQNCFDKDGNNKCPEYLDQLKNYSPEYVTSVISHEFGHAFGLKDAYGPVKDDTNYHVVDVRDINDPNSKYNACISVCPDFSTSSEFTNYKANGKHIMTGKNDSAITLNDIEMILCNFVLKDYKVTNSTQYYSPNIKTEDVISYLKNNGKVCPYSVINNNNDNCEHQISPAIGHNNKYIITLYVYGPSSNPKNGVYKESVTLTMSDSTKIPTSAYIKTAEGYYLS